MTTEDLVSPAELPRSLVDVRCGECGRSIGVITVPGGPVPGSNVAVKAAEWDSLAGACQCGRQRPAVRQFRGEIREAVRLWQNTPDAGETILNAPVRVTW